MPIPTAFDGQLNEIDDAAAVVRLQLRTMNHAAPADLPRLRVELRGRLQDFVDKVMALAPDQR